MIPELENKLEIAKRMPLTRQRDVAATLQTIVELNADEFRDEVERWAEMDNAEPIEFPPGFFDNHPEKDAAQVIEREPVCNSTEVTDELTQSIALIADASEERQRFAIRLIDEIMYNDRFEVILTPEQKREMQEQIERIKRGDERTYTLEEVMERLREPKTEH